MRKSTMYQNICSFGKIISLNSFDIMDDEEKAGPSKKRNYITPPMGRTRGPHPRSPSPETVLKAVEKLPKYGYIARNPTGYIFLDLDDDWIFSLQDLMEEFGYEIPPYFAGDQAVGAHATIVPSSIGKKFKVGDIDIGRKVAFEVVKASPTYPTRRWYGSEAVYKIWIMSEELTDISKQLGGSKYKPLYGGIISIQRK